MTLYGKYMRKNHSDVKFCETTRYFNCRVKFLGGTLVSSMSIVILLLASQYCASFVLLSCWTSNTILIITWVSEIGWLTSYATISQLCIWRHIDVQADGRKKLDLRSDSQRHWHFEGFFNVSFQALTRDHPFYGYSEKSPHFSRLLRRAWGYGGSISS